MIQDVKNDVEKLIEPILSEGGFELVELKLSRFKKRYRLQVFIDTDKGVLLDECAHLSGLIGTALDMTEFMDDGYILEVSSPGLDRPLQSDRDFKRNIGAEVRIMMAEDGREKKVKGTIAGIENESLVLTQESGRVEIALKDIKQGKIII
ncbi:MAG: ribosome maturation factor RimP [FCB group bacterium]|nr:ribosome maturation factor RimP [FCB group bacterium]